MAQRRAGNVGLSSTTRCSIGLNDFSAGSLASAVLVLAYISGALAAALHALLTKPDPRSAVGWIALCWLLPLGGAALYWLFGINRVVTHAQLTVARAGGPPTDGAASDESPGPEHAEFAALERVGAALTRLPLLGGNAIEALHNAEQAYPRMLRAIADAQGSVWLGTYIFQSDAVGLRFVDALGRAVARGVEVRVLVDGIGEWYDWPHVVPMLRRRRVPAARFLPPRLWPPNLSLNCRNHRKLLIIDSQTAFIGGMNLGGRETRGSTGRRMTDIHFHLRGPVVAQLAEVFAGDWRFASQETLPRAHVPERCGTVQCRAITGGPDESPDKLLLVILSAIASARRQILIMTPYFIPPPELIAALQSAALRGIEVSLIVPRHSNLRYIDWATLHWLPALVERGVRVHLQAPPFSHAKLFVIDGAYAHIGSVNLDTRSLRLNFEIAVELFDRLQCGQLAASIEHIRNRTAALSQADLQRAHALARIRNSLCWLISPYL